MVLNPGDAVSGSCELAGHFPATLLKDPTYLQLALPNTETGKLFLASRKTDYTDEFKANDLFVCNPTFATQNNHLEVRFVGGVWVILQLRSAVWLSEYGFVGYHQTSKVWGHDDKYVRQSGPLGTAFVVENAIDCLNDAGVRFGEWQFTTSPFYTGFVRGTAALRVSIPDNIGQEVVPGADPLTYYQHDAELALNFGVEGGSISEVKHIGVSSSGHFSGQLGTYPINGGGTSYWLTYGVSYWVRVSLGPIIE